MLYMVIEHFRGGDARPVYRRFREQGRLAPEGLRYVTSWVTEDLRRCYQVMECEDRRLLEEWIARWSDLTDFEAVPVITSPRQGGGSRPSCAWGPRAAGAARRASARQPEAEAGRDQDGEATSRRPT